MYYIYRIRNLINGKTYIGQHKYKKLNDSYLGSGILIRQAVEKYGKENFKKEILEKDIPTVELANDFEQMYILFERAKGKAEYNIANGGHGLGMHSEETRRKIGEAHKGRYCPPETRKKMSEAHRDREFTLEWRKKLSVAAKGKPKSKEAVEKNRQAHLGKKDSEETRRKKSEGSITPKVADAYKEYKLNGGTLKWNEFQKEYNRSLKK